MALTKLEQVGKFGDELGDLIIVAGGSEADVENVCTKMDQYMLTYGVKSEFVGLFKRLFEKSDPTLKMGTIEYACWLFKNNYSINQQPK